MEAIGENIECEVKGTKIILELDISGSGTPSASGKSLVFATTRGNVQIPNSPFTLGLNLYKKK